MNPLIYFSKENSLYFMPDEYQICIKCHGPIISMGYIKQFLGKKNFSVALLCSKCYKDYKPKFPIVIEDIFRVVVCDIEGCPDDATPIIFSPKNLKSVHESELTVFDISEINKRGGVTVDKTVLAGRIEPNNALHSPEEIVRLCEEKDQEKKVSIADLDNELLAFKSAKVYDEDLELGYKDKKQLGHDILPNKSR